MLFSVDNGCNHLPDRITLPNASRFLGSRFLCLAKYFVFFKNENKLLREFSAVSHLFEASAKAEIENRIMGEPSVERDGRNFQTHIPMYISQY